MPALLAPNASSPIAELNILADRRARRALSWLVFAVTQSVSTLCAAQLSWVLGAEAVIPLIERGFDVQSNGARSSVYRTPSVAGLISLGLRVHL